MKHYGNWIDLPAAARRLAEIDRQLERIASERALIELVLGKAAHPANGSDAEHRPAAQPALQPRGTAVVSKRHLPLADLVVEALRPAPREGLTVAEIIRHISARHPDRVSDPRLSASISSAIGKARSTKNPRIKILKRGRKGEASRYAAI